MFLIPYSHSEKGEKNVPIIFFFQMYLMILFEMQ